MPYGAMPYGMLQLGQGLTKLCSQRFKGMVPISWSALPMVGRPWGAPRTPCTAAARTLTHAATRASPCPYGSMEVGEGLASKLVEAKLAACVNILPGVTSVYWWDGKVSSVGARLWRLCVGGAKVDTGAWRIRAGTDGLRLALQRLRVRTHVGGTCALRTGGDPW